MYSRKDKLNYFHRLRGEKHGAADLKLLADENPTHKKLARFARDPKRYANDILYALLEVCSAEEIMENREDCELIKGEQGCPSEAEEQLIHSGQQKPIDEEQKPIDEEPIDEEQKPIDKEPIDKEEEPIDEAEEQKQVDEAKLEEDTSENVDNNDKAQDGSSKALSDAPPEEAKKK